MLSAEQLIDEYIEAYTPRAKKRQWSMTPADQLSPKQAKLARQILINPKKYGLKGYHGDLVLPTTGELVYIKDSGWSETQLDWYLEDGKFYS